MDENCALGPSPFYHVGSSFAPVSLSSLAGASWAAARGYIKQHFPSKKEQDIGLYFDFDSVLQVLRHLSYQHDESRISLGLI